MRRLGLLLFLQLFSSSTLLSVMAGPAQQERAAVSIESVTPSHGQRGETLTVTIVANNTDFVQGVTEAKFGEGISVGGADEGDYGPVTVTSKTSATARITIADDADLDERNITVRTRQDRVSGKDAFTVTAPSILITVTPDSGRQKETLTLTITGQNTHFQNGVTEAFLGDDISVGGEDPGKFGPVVVTSPTRATARIQIEGDADTGDRKIVVRTRQEHVALKNGLTVLPAPPAFTLTPVTGRQGQTVTITIDGNDTHFAQGETEVKFGPGISVGSGKAGQYGSVTVNSPSRLTAQVEIDDDADAGERTVSIRTNHEKLSNQDAFTVLPSLTPITLSPDTGMRGQELTVTITSPDAHFVDGETEAKFGQGTEVGDEEGYGPVKVLSRTRATAELSIRAFALLGARTVTVRTGKERFVLKNGFTVITSPLTFTLDPNQGQTGQTLTVTVRGQNTHFVQGLTHGRFGAGISVGGHDPGGYGPLTVESFTLATARLTISPQALTGPRTVTLKTLSEHVAVVDGFSVTPPPPTITSSVSPAPNSAGWNNADVTVTFTCAGAAGIASCTSPVQVTTETASLLVTGTAVDVAGNSSTTSVTVKLDKTAPTVQTARTPANPQGWNKTDVTVVFTGSDALSGPAGCSPNVTLTTEGASLSASGTCTDIAGNTSAPATVTGIKIDKTAPTLTFAAAAPEANAAGWNNTDVTVSFTAADALSGVSSTSLTSPLLFGTEGTSLTRSVNVTDVAGNTATFTSPPLKIDKTAPVVAVTSPANGTVATVPSIPLNGTATDSLSGLSSVTCNGLPIDPLQSPFVCDIILTSGQNVVTAFATDAAGNQASGVVNVSFVNGSITNLTAQPSTITTGLGTPVTVTARVSGIVLAPGSPVLQRVNGDGNVIATLGAMHDDGLGGDATAGDGTFTAVVTLFEATPTVVRLRVSADTQGSSGPPSPTISSVLQLSAVGISTSIHILSPAANSYFSLPTVTVQGAIGDPSLSVSVNGIAATKSGNTFTVGAVPLIEGANTLTAIATAANGSTGSDSVQVLLDTTPPRVTITSPVDGGHTTNSFVDVTGIVNDIVFGTVNPQQATVTVNGVQAAVANRTFSSTNVPLQLGANSIRAEGRDRVGNTYAQVINVTRDALPPGIPTIRASGGGNQTGMIGAQLPVPLSVQLTDAQNQPAANVPVIFRVTESDGLVNGLAAVAANTDAQGRAQVNYTLGTRAGAGSNRVTAFATGFLGTADFIASALNGTATKIVVDSGLNQTGSVGEALPFPFVAVVTDSGNNRIGGVPVTFNVRSGNGKINGGGTFSTTSDSDGRVSATLTLGPDEGVSNNVVEANFNGNTGQAAIFNASALTPGRADATTISGVVLDNSNRPIPNVTIRMFRVALGANNVLPMQIGTPTPTDAQGTFRVANAPVGIMKLMADGSTALPAGDWPTLEYDLLTVAGRDNTLGTPIYLPRLDQANRLCVTQATGGTLTLPQVPGFALTVAPGSATFPGGARTGCISVTPVNPDKVPMAPGFGQQPRFVVTIQPVGTTFNPPARIQIPNVDGLAPRSKTEMYSYDHDLAAFVAIGAGTVSEDGSLVLSDPGVGVMKAGWHCGGNPNPTGSAGTCPTCQTCQNGSCVPSAGSCDDHNACTENDRCENGACTGTPFQPPTSRVTDQFDVSFPPSLLDKINSVFNYIPGLQGSHFDTVRVGGSTRTSDCCDQNTGIVRDGLTEKSGRFQLEINLLEGIRLWGTPRYDDSFGVGGVAEVQITFDVSITTLRGRFQFNAEVGSRDKQCEPRENCIFGEINAVQQVDLIRATAELKACVAVFGTDVGCAGARLVLIPGRVTFGWGVTYNKPSCGAGLGGTAYIGAVVARGEFSITVGGSEYRIVRQITIFQGVSGL